MVQKYTTFAFCIGHIQVKVPITKDKYELRLPDPYSWKIYGDRKKLGTLTHLFMPLNFDFQSLIDTLPFKRDTLEVSLMDDLSFSKEDYYGTNYLMKNNLSLLMDLEGSQMRCHNNRSHERTHLITNKYEYVTYFIFIEGTEGEFKYLPSDGDIIRYNNICNVNPIKGGKLVVKNMHYYGAWVKYSGYIS